MAIEEADVRGPALSIFAERSPAETLGARVDSVGETPGELAEPNNPAVERRHTDFPVPRVQHACNPEFTWDEGLPLVKLYQDLGRALATGDLYRAPTYASGLILGSKCALIPPTPVTESQQLGPIILDRLRILHIKDGKIKGRAVPSKHLHSMAHSEVFLQQFPAVDEVCTAARYLADFSLTIPGYNDGGRGQRFLFVGPPAQIEDSTEFINRFLNVMAFETDADRTNTVAAALTVMLVNHWPGAKPLLCVGATKSHAGKDTIIAFACGSTTSVAISYQSTDWALERAFVGALKHNPRTGVVVLENARLEKQNRFLASAFVERFITDPEPFLFATGTGSAVRRANHYVVAISSNVGAFSEDQLNRGLPIYLRPVGNIADRVSPIGNPKLEFLPANRARIEAELRGMIENWKAAGQPLDTAVRHPFTQWAQTIGGILKVNGFDHFLENYRTRKTADDPLRRGIGLLGAAHPDVWCTATEWARTAVERGLVKAIIPQADRENEASRARGIGVVFSGLREETFTAETDDERLTLRLEKRRQRFEVGKEPLTKYRFGVLVRDPIPEDSTATPPPTPRGSDPGLEV